MKHEFSDALRADPERFELAQRAAKLLDDLTKRTVVPATAIWRLSSESLAGGVINSPSLIEVEVRDREGTSRVEQIRERDRDNNFELGYRIAHLWGDLLEERSYRYFEPQGHAETPVGAMPV